MPRDLDQDNVCTRLRQVRECRVPKIVEPNGAGEARLFYQAVALASTRKKPATRVRVRRARSDKLVRHDPAIGMAGANPYYENHEAGNRSHPINAPRARSPGSGSCAEGCEILTEVS